MSNYYDWNDYYGSNEPHYPGGTKRSPGLETAALVLGITGLFTASCGMGIMLGALAVILGLLSKGGAETCGSKGRAGIILGVAAIIATAFSLALSFTVLMAQFGGWDGFVQQYEQLYNALESGDAAGFADFYNQFYNNMGLTP